MVRMFMYCVQYNNNNPQTDNSSSSIHGVTLFHYLAWPDHGVPANAISMINFIRRVRKSHPYSNTDLMVVHCSAGVGRTGTFITLDYMLERIKTEKSINIHEFVTGLRKQRVLMVQTSVSFIDTLKLSTLHDYIIHIKKLTSCKDNHSLFNINAQLHEFTVE